MSTVELRENLSDAVNRAAFGKERVVLTRRGKKLAGIVPYEDIETLEALEEQKDIEDAKRSLKEAAKKGTISLDELKKELSEVSTKTTQLVDALSDNPLTQKKGIASDISDLKKKVHEHEEIVKKIKWSWWWIISIASVVSFLVQLILKLVS